MVAIPPSLDLSATSSSTPYADLDGSNNVTMRRMYGGGFDELVVRRDAAGNAGWYLTDKLNSVRAIADDAGTVVATATYLAFGESVTTGAIDRFQYTSQERDILLKLDYSNARMRDPVTSMFLNEDPMSFAAGDPNLRRYVRNGATNATDPSGLKPWWQRFDEWVDDKSGRHWEKRTTTIAMALELERILPQVLPTEERCWSRGGGPAKDCYRFRRILNCCT